MRGLLDTSVVISLEDVDPAQLPDELAISAHTLAELAAGPHATTDVLERARRQDRLQRVERTLDVVPFAERAAQAYGSVYAATVAADRKPKGARVVDLLIAATAMAERVPLYTRNGDDVRHLEAVGLQVVDV